MLDHTIPDQVHTGSHDIKFITDGDVIIVNFLKLSNQKKNLEMLETRVLLLG